MKSTLLTILVLLIAAPAMAAEPTLFECKSDQDKLQVIYTSSSIVGNPTFKVVLDGREVTADADTTVILTQEQTVLGMVVSASVHSKIIMDLPDTVYSLVVPRIELGNERTLAFQALYLVSYSGGFLALPAVMQRIASTRSLDCIATRVQF